MSGAVRVGQRLYLVEDRSQAVPDGHPDARFLLCPAGGEVSHADAVRYGLLKSEPEAELESEAEPEAKQAPPPANKARGKAADK